MTLASLSNEEKQKLDLALLRAEEFARGEEMELMRQVKSAKRSPKVVAKMTGEFCRQPLEGTLLKFTNAFQGWQNRWFVLDTRSGELRYYLKEEHREGGKPRGGMRLAGAIISPSEEDSLAFIISPVSGDPYKLKASDTRQRSEWINRLRTAAEDQKEKKIRKALKPMKTPSVGETVRRGTAREATMFYQLHRVSTAATEQQQAMCRAMEALPSDEALKKDILLLKATSQAVLNGINDCQHMLMELSQVTLPVRGGSRLGRQLSETVSTPSPSFHNSANPSSKSKLSSAAEEAVKDSLQITQLDELDYNAEEKDKSDKADEELGSVEENKTLILNLLSRLKLGTDLTQVSFPAFILQSRSLLESCSDFFANARLFVDIPDQSTPETRMIQLVKWYLSSFYCGLRTGQVRKPYNPVIGEVFRCTWILPQQSGISPRIHFFAEQVSHHPPITAIYAHCPEKEIFFNCWLWPRSKFMGMHMSAAMSGEGTLVIGAQKGRRAEQYHLTFPTIYARSILTTPWLELGGKIHLTCPQRGITSTVTFHTKPFYGGKLHRVSAEIRNCTGAVFCKVQGEWNRGLELSHADGRIETLEVGGAGWSAERRIRPAHLQHPREARRVWALMTEKLRSGDTVGAAEEKARVEEEQRTRMQAGGYQSAHFQRSGEEGWLWAGGFPGLFDE